MYMVCPKLDFAVRVHGDSEEIESLLGPKSPHAKARCPDCGELLSTAPFLSDGLASRVQHVLHDLSPMEAHLALEGLGFPEERSCGEDTVKSVLLQKVVSMRVREIRGTGRTVVDSLTMEDGTTVFLSGSGWGALIYRIRKAQPYTSKEAT